MYIEDKHIDDKINEKKPDYNKESKNNRNIKEVLNLPYRKIHFSVYLTELSEAVPELIPLKKIEQSIDEITKRLEKTPNYLEQSNFLLQMGDLWYNKYLQTRDSICEENAKNCFYEARIFYHLHMRKVLEDWNLKPNGK